MNSTKTPLVLVVDDEVNIRKTIARTLRKVECEVQTAVNGEEALSMIRERTPDLILLDMKMPGMDGLEVLRALDKERVRSRVIVITAYGTVENAVEAMKLGAVDFLQKPFLPDDIRELVSAVLDRPHPADLQPDKHDYDELIAAAHAALRDRDYDRARSWLRRAKILSDARPEVHNLLGAMYELRGETDQARKMYRVALAVDPSYRPAIENLDRLTEMGGDRGPISFGRERPASDETNDA